MSFRNISQLQSDSDNTDTDSVVSCNSPINNLIEANSVLESLIQDISSLKIIEMATPTLKREYLDMIPEFHGDAKLLTRFIEVCEKLVNKFYNVADPNDFQNEYLMSSILSKIKGEAASNIATCTVTSWQVLKKALLDTYSDKRDCYTLNIEMTELKQNNESAFEFYNKVKEVLNLQIAYISTQIKAEEQGVLIGYFQNYAVRILLRGLKEPLGNLMRTKSPTDMNSALNMLTNDFQIESHLRLHQTQKFNATPKQKQFINNTHNRPPFKQQTPQLMYRPMQQNNYNHTPQHAQNFKQNAFKSNPNQKFPKPTPMSVNTHQSFVPKPGPSGYNQPRPQQFAYRQFPQTQQRPNFIFEELHNTETNEINDEFDTEDNNIVTYQPETSTENYNPEQDPDPNYFLEIAAPETPLN